MSNKSKLIVFVAVLASLLEIIDTSIVNVALPTMMGNLGSTLEDISMIITGYAIANAIVLPVSAWASERFGRRKYYLSCILAFTFFSVACGLAPNLAFLVVFRIFQGLMGGALLPTSQALIYEQFPKEKAGLAGALFGMSVMIGPALGPVLGGYLTDNFGWRSIFNINLPLGILAFFMGMAVIFDREKSDHELAAQKGKSTSFDGVGFALLCLGIGCLQFVLERGESDDWFDSKIIIVNTIISAVSIPLFIWWELKVKNPILNIRLFADKIVVYGVSLMGALGFFLYGLVFLLPVFLGQSYHYTATQVGIMFIPGSILTALLMPFIGRAMQAGRNPKTLILVGLVSIECCLFLFTHLSPLSSEKEVLTALYVRGFAMAFLFVPINSSILSQFGGAELGQVSGLLNLFRQIGGSIGVAMVATMLTTFSHQNYLDMAAKVSLLNSNTQTAYYSSQQGMAGKNVGQLGISTPTSAAEKTLSYRLQAQVFMLSFNQLIWTIMMIFSISFIPWYLIRLRKKPTGPIDAH
jgi:MFS transporter, DHA2 family, multidrug resistance protein